MRINGTGVTCGNRRVAFWVGLAVVALPGFGWAQSAPAYNITTIAGTGTAGYGGDGAAATAAQLSGPCAVAVDSSGNVYIADTVNYRIRKMTVGGNISTIVGNGTAGDTTGTGTSSEVRGPCGMAFDSTGNLYFADSTNHEVKKMTTGGTVSVVAGSSAAGGGFSGDGNQATAGQLDFPEGVALDSAGNLYIGDSTNERIREVLTSGIILTIAGDGNANYTNDGAPAGAAELNNPTGLAMDSAGNLYVADTDNHVIRKIAAGSQVITTVAGNGTGGFSGDRGPATKAQLYHPKGVAVDAAGNLYIADTGNSRIREVLANGTIFTIAGTGALKYGGDGGLATAAQLQFPAGVAVDAAGHVYIADTGNSAIRMLTAAPTPPQAPPTVTGVVSSSSFGALSAIAPGSWIEISGTDLAADSRLWTQADFQGIAAPTSLDGTSVTIGGQSAFVSAISPTQVNVQVPSNVGPGPQPLLLTTGAGTSTAFSVTVSEAAPGLYTASQLAAGGKQYTASFNAPPLTFVGPAGAFSGLTSRPASPGDVIVVYGVGFGAVTPAIPAGQVVRSYNSVSAPVQFFIGQIPATLIYDGLAPGNIGLYQFNIVVPNVGAGAAVPLTFTVNGVSGTQALYVAIQ